MPDGTETVQQHISEIQRKLFVISPELRSLEAKTALNEIESLHLLAILKRHKETAKTHTNALIAYLQSMNEDTKSDNKPTLG